MDFIEAIILWIDKFYNRSQMYIQACRVEEEGKGDECHCIIICLSVVEIPFLCTLACTFFVVA